MTNKFIQSYISSITYISHSSHIYLIHHIYIPKKKNGTRNIQCHSQGWKAKSSQNWKYTSKVCFSLYIQHKQRLGHIHPKHPSILLICSTHLSLFISSSPVQQYIINCKGEKIGKVQSHMTFFTRRNTSHHYQSNSDEKFGLRRPSF